MIHPDTCIQKISPEIGLGAVATSRIVQGTFTWVQDSLDLELTPDTVSRLGAQWSSILDRTTFLAPSGNLVQCWDHARLINHSCEPNTAGTQFGFEIALRDIEAGEQLTNDYATFTGEQGEVFVCQCLTPSCRGHVAPGLPAAAELRLAPALAVALSRAGVVPQPLDSLLRPGQVARAANSFTLKSTKRRVSRLRQNIA